MNTGGEGAHVLTAGCLFSGMGGFAAGLIDAGFEVRWANDYDEFACAAFRHRFPDVTLVEDDVRNLSVERDNLVPVDVLAGGFPCQSFSQAGGRRGFADPRGRLYFEIPRILADFEPQDRPALVVLENVPHLLYGSGGEWFEQIRRTLRRVIERPSVSLDRDVLRTIFRVMEEYWDGDRALFKRETFRNWMIALNRRGGVVLRTGQGRAE